MIERRMSVDEHGAPVLTIIATDWDGIRRIAEPLCAGTVEAGEVGFRALEVRDAYLALKRLPVLRRTNRYGSPLSHQQLMTVAEVAVSARHASDVIWDSPADLLLHSDTYADRTFGGGRHDPHLDEAQAADLAEVAIRGAGLVDDETAGATS